MRKVKELLQLTPLQIAGIACDFETEMRLGLRQQGSSLKMLPSFLARPTGKERGKYLALDFGGTNVRALRVCLAAGISIEKMISVPLKDSADGYDYTSDTSDAAALFDFIAAMLAKIAQNHSYDLGHTFSFPCMQKDINSAVLLTWTKEIKTPHVEGRDVTELLQAALHRQGLMHINCRAVINDTVGTLLTAAYLDFHADIGSICGTGHNTCYLEPLSPLTGRPMIINLESGNFNKLPITPYDRLLDQGSEKKGRQHLEKMAAGRYLGELTRIVLQDVSQRHGDILPACLFAEPYSLTAKDLSLMLADDTPQLRHIEKWLAMSQKVGLPLEARRLLQTVSQLVTTRSAQLAAATYLGILRKIDPDLNHPHTIAIDGSLYEKLPGYAAAIQDTLSAALPSSRALVRVQLTKDGSGLGAAIAAAIAGEAERR